MAAISRLFKKINQKIPKILKNNRDFFLWALVFLSIDYVVFFAIEITLPGLIMGNFNLNILLAIVLLGWIFFFNYYELDKINCEKNKNIFNIFFLFFLIVTGWLVLYNIIFWEFLVILFLLFLVAFYFLKE